MRALAVVVGALIGLARASTPWTQQVYENGQFGWPCYRQPVLQAWGDTVLAFVEGRNNTCCWGLRDGSPKGILVRRSVDRGATFGEAQLLWTGGPDFFVAQRDAASGTVYVFIQEGGEVLLTTSQDGGASWSKPAAIKVAAPFKTFKPAVGHGVQLDATLCGSVRGEEALPASLPAWHGRLVLPFVCVGETSETEVGDIACPGCYSCLMLSDDGGKTWRAGAASLHQEGTREPSVVQVCRARRNGTSAAAEPAEESSGARAAAAAPEPIVFLSERNMGASKGHRAWAESTDGGETISAYGLESELTSPVTHNWTGIVGAVERAGQVVAYSGPLSTDARATMGVRASRTEATSWASKASVIWPGPAGYSDMQPANASHLWVIFEAGPNHFAEGIKLSLVDATALPQ